MLRLFLFLGPLLLSTACGVKAPPVAPEHRSSSISPKLECSAYDPTCDKEDPNYVPQGKKGKYPPRNDE